MYVTEPRVARLEAHRRIAAYKAIKVLGDGSIWTRSKPQSDWVPAAKDLWASDYCIDGYVYPPDSGNATEGATYFHRLDRQAIRACGHPQVPQASYKKVYFYVLFISTFLLGVTVLIYGLVWPKQNIHGRTSAAFMFCMFIYFVTLMIGNSAEKSFGSSYCITNGILQHYFQLAMFYWMAVMNFDVWSTIRSMVAVSQRGKGNKRFALYCSFAFTCPAIVVATGVAIQNNYTLDQDRVVLPLYGYVQCALDKDSQLYYFLWPSSFVFVIGIAFGLMTMYTLHKLKKDTKRISNSNTKNAQKQWHVILKLSLLTGVSWIADLAWAIWAPDITWWWLVLDTYNLLQPFFLFWIFVMKKEIRTQLLDKYPILFKHVFGLWDKATSKMPSVGGKGVKSAGETHTTTGLSSTFQSQSEA